MDKKTNKFRPVKKWKENDRAETLRYAGNAKSKIKQKLRTL